ncbi:MAG TPA: acyloxyacyl hydrolase [Xanthobacteraceae bacterium]|nr:acyloxyacyl hydrolase [Xanthobacteraceae bacterium]
MPKALRVVLGALVLSAACEAAPVSAQEARYWREYEVRLGAMMHGLWGPEPDSLSINGEFILPKFSFAPIAPSWQWLIPRFHFGGMLNTAGKTNYMYAGALWTYDLTDRLFVEGFLGGAVHDGSLLGAPGRNALGCRVLYHLGGSIGYRFSPRWSAMVTLDHISNGTGMFSDCPRNQGLNELGIRVGYSF